MKIKPCINLGPAACVKHSKSTACRVSIEPYKHRQEPIRLHKLSQVFKGAYCDHFFTTLIYHI